MRLLRAIRLATCLLSAAPCACSGPSGPEGAGGGDSTTTHPSPPPLQGQDDCTVVVHANIPEPNREHVDVCTVVDYATPPSGGDHWPIWATFAEHDEVVPREMYVHDLEHGAIVFTHSCDPADCDDILKAMRAEVATMSDPLCLEMVGPKARALITPDPLLTTPIALSAWGATYTATCIDPPSIHAFVTAHYGNGPEELCIEGTTAPECP